MTCFHCQGARFLVPRLAGFYSQSASFPIPRVPGVQFPGCVVFNLRVLCYHFQGARFSLLGCQFFIPTVSDFFLNVPGFPFPGWKISIPREQGFNTFVPFYHSQRARFSVLGSTSQVAS